MAEEAGVATAAPETDISTSTAPAEGSSSAGAQGVTPAEANPAEARDNATFARYGLKPDGSPLDPEPEAKLDESTTTDSDDDEATAAADAEDADEEVEITDEQLDRYVEALLELNADKIAQNPALRARIEAEVRAQVEQDYEARQRAATAGQERERLTAQGRSAVEAIATVLNRAQEGFAKAAEELKKAEAGTEFNPAVIAEGLKYSTDDLRNSLAQYAQAATFDVRRSHEDAFLSAFQTASAKGGPITAEEVETVKNIVNTANRMEADEKQGPERFDKAKAHYYGETVKFLTDRAFEAGRQAALDEAKARRAAAKTVLDADAVLAGAAKEAARRSALPPATPPAGQQADSGAATIEAYRAAKAAGDTALADAIMNRMQMTAPPEAQRRLRR